MKFCFPRVPMAHYIGVFYIYLLVLACLLYKEPRVLWRSFLGLNLVMVIY